MLYIANAFAMILTVSNANEYSFPTLFEMGFLLFLIQNIMYRGKFCIGGKNVRKGERNAIFASLIDRQLDKKRDSGF